MNSMSPALGVAVSVIGLLTAGTIVRLSTLRDRTSPLARKRIASLFSWWIVAGWVLAAALGGRFVAAVLFSVVSCLAFREYVLLLGRERVGTLATGIGCVGIATTYVGLATGAGPLWLASVPLAVALLSSGLLAGTAKLGAFPRRASCVVYGVLLACSLPACSLLLGDPGGDEFAGMFLFLVGLTEWNDILAAWTGRAIGKRKLAPMISPHKTVEGFVGGVLGTVALAWWLGPWLTSLNVVESVFFGFVVALAATAGDLNMSAIKRAAGVKDSGTLLPGQGGVLDRIDSLTFSAPVALVVSGWLR